MSTSLLNLTLGLISIALSFPINTLSFPANAINSFNNILPNQQLSQYPVLSTEWLYDLVTLGDSATVLTCRGLGYTGKVAIATNLTTGQIQAVCVNQKMADNIPNRVRYEYQTPSVQQQIRMWVDR